MLVPREIFQDDSPRSVLGRGVRGHGSSAGCWHEASGTTALHYWSLQAQGMLSAQPFCLSATSMASAELRSRKILEDNLVQLYPASLSAG